MAPRPGDVIPVTIEAAMGADLTAAPGTWTWTDLGTRLLGEATIVRGRADEAQQTQPATLTVRLRDTDGWLTPRHPSSPWYLMWKRGTPIRLKVTVPGDATYTRFQGRVTVIKPVWPSGNSEIAFVDVTAKGMLYTLQQGRPPAVSPLFRAISARSEARAYWPMEDGAGATSAASGIPTGTPMLVGNVNFAADATEPGSLPLPTFTSTGSVWGWVTGPFNGHWQADWYLKLNDPTPAQPNILTVYTSNAGAPNINWNVFTGSGAGVYGVRANDATGTIIVNSSAGFGSVFFGQWVHVRLMTNQVGGNISWQLVLFPLVGNGLFISGSVAGTVGGPTAIGISDPALTGMAIGHVAVMDAFNLGAADAAQSGFNRELATDRVARLCADAAVPVTVTGTSDVQMGPQPLDTLISALRRVEDADLGILTDGLGPGLGYLTRTARYNQPVTLALDADRGQVKWPPFEPLEDDARLRNRFTAARINGSSATYADPGVTTEGEYPGRADLSLSDDSTLANQAAWRTRLFTPEEMRTPTLVIDVRNSPELLAQWLAMDIGERYTVANPPDQYPPGGLDLVLEQYTETIDGITWRVTLTGSPFAPWGVTALAADTGDTGEFVGRLDTDGSALATAEAAVAPGTVESWQAGTPSGPQWTAAADDLPFDVDCRGEQVRVTAVSNAVSDTFTRTTVAGWGTADSGQIYTTSPAGDHSTSGTRGVQTLSSVNVLRDAGLGVSWPDIDITVGRSGISAAPTGANCEIHLVARYVDPNNFVDVRLFRAPAGSVTIAVRERKAGVDTTTAFPVVSGVTASGAIAVRLQAIATTVRARAWLSGGTEPGGWDVTLTTTHLAAGDIRLRSLLATGNTNGSLTADWDDVTVSNPQTFTVTRGINGVQKAHPAGASISVWDPIVLAL